jgi:gas vesicle protein
LRGRLFRGLAAGALLGAAAGMLFMPNMDRRTRKKLVKAGRWVTDFTGDMWGGIKDFKK